MLQMRDLSINFLSWNSQLVAKPWTHVHERVSSPILACHRMLKLYFMQQNLSWLLQVLQERLQASGMPLEPYAAYLDIREYGTVPHSGFGLGFERLILFATGLENIREAIPFPRWPGHAEC